jgi:hypothetical protein
LFPNTDINEVHHHLFCINRNCTGFSKAEKNRQSHLKEKFDHTWLSEKSLSFCEATRIWNVVFIEGFEIYCLLCKKHNTKNNRNKSTVFSEVPSTHYKFQYEVNFPSETEISISSLFYYHLFAITFKNLFSAGTRVSR